jgi:hypothetical protein
MYGGRFVLIRRENDIPRIPIRRGGATLAEDHNIAAELRRNVPISNFIKPAASTGQD